jgi:hypothetical protein
MGEFGDIIRNMHKALKMDGLKRAPITFDIHDGPPDAPIFGSVVNKYLPDDLAVCRV